MASLTSPRPDGYNDGFYQSYWHIVGDEVSSTTLKFLNGGSFDKGINYTYLDLIPKIRTP